MREASTCHSPGAVVFTTTASFQRRIIPVGNVGFDGRGKAGPSMSGEHGPLLRPCTTVGQDPDQHSLVAL